MVGEREGLKSGKMHTGGGIRAFLRQQTVPYNNNNNNIIIGIMCTSKPIGLYNKTVQLPIIHLHPL